MSCGWQANWLDQPHRLEAHIIIELLFDTEESLRQSSFTVFCFLLTSFNWQSIEIFIYHLFGMRGRLYEPSKTYIENIRIIKKISFYSVLHLNSFTLLCLWTDYNDVFISIFFSLIDYKKKQKRTFNFILTEIYILLFSYQKKRNESVAMMIEFKTKNTKFWEIIF